MRCDHLRCEHTLYFVACSHTGHCGQRVIDISCLGRAPGAPVAGRVDDATEHQIGEARVDRTERGHEADCINVLHVDVERLTRQRFHCYCRWFPALLTCVHEYLGLSRLGSLISCLDIRNRIALESSHTARSKNFLTAHLYFLKYL